MWRTLTRDQDVRGVRHSPFNGTANFLYHACSVGTGNRQSPCENYALALQRSNGRSMSRLLVFQGSEHCCCICKPFTSNANATLDHIFELRAATQVLHI